MGIRATGRGFLVYGLGGRTAGPDLISCCGSPTHPFLTAFGRYPERFFERVVC